MHHSLSRSLPSAESAAYLSVERGRPCQAACRVDDSVSCLHPCGPWKGRCGQTGSTGCVTGSIRGRERRDLQLERLDPPRRQAPQSRNLVAASGDSRTHGCWQPLTDCCLAVRSRASRKEEEEGGYAAPVPCVPSSAHPTGLRAARSCGSHLDGIVVYEAASGCQCSDEAQQVHPPKVKPRLALLPRFFCGGAAAVAGVSASRPRRPCQPRPRG